MGDRRSPLRTPAFRAFWIAGLFSNLGSWIHLVAAGWLMTSLTVSAAPVALLLTATAVPTFLLSLPAGALADVVDRRRLIVVTQALQAVVAAALAGLALAGGASPKGLLVLTLMLSVGASLGGPVLQAITPELIDRDNLPAAIALNSTSFTLSQAIGPALGGLLVAIAGPGAAFGFNAVSFLGLVAVAFFWRRTPQLAQLPAEHVLGAIRSGLRYVRHAPALNVVLGRAAAYALCFTVVPALLAVVSRTRLGADAGQFGLLLGSLGIGGVAGSVLLPRLRQRLDHERLVMTALGLYAAVLVTLSQLHALWVAFPVMALAGFAGMTTMSTFNIAAQTVLPNWVRGRGLAIYQLVFAVAMAAGSAGWGFIAGRFGLTTTLIAAAAGMVVNIVLARVLRLAVVDAVDSGPLHADAPYFDARLDPDDGPLFVTVEYRIAEQDLRAFRTAMRAIREIRERDGAMHWGIFQSLADPGLHIENYLVSSWAEYERLVSRGVVSDGPVLAGAEKLHSGPEPPRSSRFLGHHFRPFHSS
jgi:predicted MFS family arabinose efflux permease